jgi:hypothetical protein
MMEEDYYIAISISKRLNTSLTLDYEAKMTSLIQLYWYKNAEEISTLQSGRNIRRYEALRDIIHQKPSYLEPIIAAGDSETMKSMIDSTFDDMCRVSSQFEYQRGKPTFSLEVAYRDYLRLVNDTQSITPVLLKEGPRNIPTMILLTTQAPGMSDAFAGYWIDEEMGLINLCNSFYSARETPTLLTLEDEAKMLAIRYEDEIVQIAEGIILQFNLGHKISTDNRRGCILSLLMEYSDVAEETAKVFILNQIGKDSNYQHELRIPSMNLEPHAVTHYVSTNLESLINQALLIVVSENSELLISFDVSDQSKLGQFCDSDLAILRKRIFEDEQSCYLSEVVKYIFKLARDEVLGSLNGISKDTLGMIKWYAYADTDKKALPPILRLRLLSLKGMVTARYEVISKYLWHKEHNCIQLASYFESDFKGKEWRPLFEALNHPLFAFEARGINKKYNRGYGPSRVDLGKRERLTTESYAQWIGPADQAAYKRISEFYSLFNFSVHCFDDVKEGELMKPLENALMEASLAVTHLFIPIFQAVGVGNLTAMIGETNKRPETFTRSGGSGSSGFCQPKDIYYPPFVTCTTLWDILDSAGIEISTWKEVAEAMRKRTNKIDSGYQDQVPGYIQDSLSRHLESESHFYHLTPNKPLPPQSALDAFCRIGMRQVELNPQDCLKTLIAEWHSACLISMESRMRFAPVNVLYHLRQGFEQVRLLRGENGITWKDSVLVFPVEYKPVSDARLSVGMRMFEFLCNTGGHLTATLDKEGVLLSTLLLHGYENAKNMKRKCISWDVRKYLAEKVYKGTDLTEEQEQMMYDYFPRVDVPSDIRLFSPFNLSKEAIFHYVSGSQIEESSRNALNGLGLLGIKEEIVKANCLSYGGNIYKWKCLSKSQLSKIDRELQMKIHCLVLEYRLSSPEHRIQFSDYWECFRGSDVFSTIVHYEPMAGSEDTGNEIRLDQTEEKLMIENLVKLRDTMRDGRPQSALIWLDAPVQGRKPCADMLSIKQWLALGGWYVCPTISSTEVSKLLDHVNEERRIVSQIISLLFESNWEGVDCAVLKLADIAQDRYSRARSDAELAKRATLWWRGGGFLNYDWRHRVYAQAWRNIIFASNYREVMRSHIDIGTLVLCGLMHSWNGEMSSLLHQNMYLLEEKLSLYQDSQSIPSSIRPVAGRSFSLAETKKIQETFILSKSDDIIDSVPLDIGESSSIKRREDDTERASGQALANFKSSLIAREAKERNSGWLSHNPTLHEDRCIPDMVYEAYHLLTGDGLEKIDDRCFGTFVHCTETILAKLRRQVIRSAESRDKLLSLKYKSFPLIVNGILQMESWWSLLGTSECPGELGELALHCDGDKILLRDIALCAGLVETVIVVGSTLRYYTMSSENVNQFGGIRSLSYEVVMSLCHFFSKTLYDHTFDYLPTWMHPSVTTAFTNYNPIMGHWLGDGYPLTFEQCLALAIDSHWFINLYIDKLLRTKTALLTQSVHEVDHIIGRVDTLGSIRESRVNFEVIPLGVKCNLHKDPSSSWWSYTEKREIVFQIQQGHIIRDVLTDFPYPNLALVNDNMEYVLGDNHQRIVDFFSRSNILIVSPTGRPHLTCFLREAPCYNQEHPQHSVNIFISRAYNFDSDLMTISGGYLYVSPEDYRALKLYHFCTRTPNCTKEQLQNLDCALSAKFPHWINESYGKGIFIGVQFMNLQGPVNCLSMPFHGAPYYIEGKDEAIGLPTTQSWIHNITPGYSKGEEHIIHSTISPPIYPEEYRWLKCYQYDIENKPVSERIAIERILGGYKGFPGMKNLPWFGAISKPFRQSGGRGAFPVRIRSMSTGELDIAELTQFANNVVKQGK